MAGRTLRSTPRAAALLGAVVVLVALPLASRPSAAGPPIVTLPGPGSTTTTSTTTSTTTPPTTSTSTSTSTPGSSTTSTSTSTSTTSTVPAGPAPASSTSTTTAGATTTTAVEALGPVDRLLVAAGGVVQLVDADGIATPLFDAPLRASVHDVAVCDGLGLVVLAMPTTDSVQLVGPAGGVEVLGLQRPTQVLCGAESIAYVGEDGLHLLQADWLVGIPPTPEPGLVTDDLVIAHEGPVLGELLSLDTDEVVLAVPEEGPLLQVDLRSGAVEEVAPGTAGPGGASTEPLPGIHCLVPTEGRVLCGDEHGGTVELHGSDLRIVDIDGRVVEWVVEWNVVDDPALTGGDDVDALLDELLSQEPTWQPGDVVPVRAQERRDDVPDDDPPPAEPADPPPDDPPADDSDEGSIAPLVGGVIAALLLAAALLWWWRRNGRPPSPGRDDGPRWDDPGSEHDGGNYAGTPATGSGGEGDDPEPPPGRGGWGGNAATLGGAGPEGDSAEPGADAGGDDGDQDVELHVDLDGDGEQTFPDDLGGDGRPGPGGVGP